MSEEEVIYPDPVLEISQKIFDTVFDDNVFFEENEIKDVELGRECAMNCTKDFFLKKFIAGENLKFKDEDEVGEFLNLVNADCALQSLQKKGFLDSLYDPNKDDTVFFLTEEGRKLAEAMEKIQKLRGSENEAK